ncbi:MAG TPA: LemA family protein [Ktedonobacteraceae bacterium]|nr:LemA family protein [Ktedonobacteraceae bacterium]
MFDKEGPPIYDRGAGYNERPGDEYTSPAYAEKIGSRQRDQFTAPKHFWTRAKIISAVVLVVVIVGGIVCISQSIAIQQRQYDIQGNVGNVWNEVDRASQLLQQDAALLNSTIASQNDAITKIAEARSNAATIKASQGTGDTNAALSAAGQMTAGIRVFVENYPDYGVGSNSHTVLVQIEGSFNRVEYARSQLIQTQTDFNKWLLTQIPMNLFYHPVQILGANANPAEQVPVPRYVQPTP